jgi:hypothetical protein
LTDLLTVGYDRNNDARPYSYYNNNSTDHVSDYILMSTDPNIELGSMMMRPIFYNIANNVPTGVLQPNHTLKNSLILYPNPTSSSISITLKEDIQKMSYTIYSLYGQVMATGEITPEENSIPVGFLSTGMYLITCTDAQNITYSSRFIKE